MAVRRFDGVDDVIICTPPSPNFTGDGTWGFVWRTDTNRNNGLACLVAAGFERVGAISVASDAMYYTTNAGFSQCDAFVADEWYLTVFTKAAGVSAVRSHTMPFSTGVWSHTDHGTLNDGVTSQDELQFGYDVQNNFRHLGELAASGLWVGTALSDAECETLDAGVNAWLALAPDGLWVFNQETTADPVLDLTGNGADQTSITGTTVVTGDDPPGFDMSTGPNEGAVDFVVSLSLATAGARASEGEAAYQVSLSAATAGQRASQGVVDYLVSLQAATEGHRASSGAAAWTATVRLATVGADPTNAPISPPTLTAEGLHALALTADGVHDPSLRASGSHPI